MVRRGGNRRSANYMYARAPARVAEEKEKEPDRSGGGNRTVRLTLYVIFPAAPDPKHEQSADRSRPYAWASGGGASSRLTLAASSRANSAATRSSRARTAVAPRSSSVLQDLSPGFEAPGDPLRELLVQHGSPLLSDDDRADALPVSPPAAADDASQGHTLSRLRVAASAVRCER